MRLKSWRGSRPELHAASFMPFLVPLLAGSTTAPCAMQACSMHGRRGGTWLVSQRRALWGGIASLGFLCPPSLTEPTFPVDSAFGAGQLQLWSAGGLPSRLPGLAGAAPCASEPRGRLAEAAIKIGALECAGGAMSNTTGRGCMLEWRGRGAARLPLLQPWGSFCGWSPTAVVVQPVARPLVPLVPLVPSSRRPRSSVDAYISDVTSGRGRAGSQEPGGLAAAKTRARVTRQGAKLARTTGSGRRLVGYGRLRRFRASRSYTSSFRAILGAARPWRRGVRC
jgi:hypothetical protein